MSDVVVTVPKRFKHAGFRGLTAWAAEGCLPGDPDDGNLYEFTTYGTEPVIHVGERVFVVCEDRLRGYAPLVGMTFCPRISTYSGHELRVGSVCLFRGAGAKAVTIPEKIRGFRGWRYRWWKLEDEVPFPDWLPDDKREAIAAAYMLDGPGDVK